MWMHQLNAVLGSLVVTIGLWILLGQLSLELALFIVLIIAIFLVWITSHVLSVWAWTTLLMGIESIGWPVWLMIQLKRSGIEPSEDQMQTLLTAALFGVFASIFWFTFSYGLFRWSARETAPPAPAADATAHPAQPTNRKKRRRH